MKNSILIFSIALLLTACGGRNTVVNDLATDNPIQTSFDLTSVINDQVPDRLFYRVQLH